MEETKGRLGESPGKEEVAGWGRSQAALPDVKTLLTLWIDDVRAENYLE